MAIFINSYGIGKLVMFSSTRVANELGAGNPWAARAVVSAALALTFSMAMLVACFLLLVRNLWGLVYSNDEEVINTVKGLVPLLALSTTVDAIQAVLSGIYQYVYIHIGEDSGIPLSFRLLTQMPLLFCYFLECLWETILKNENSGDQLTM